MDTGKKLGRRQYEILEDTNTNVVIEEAAELDNEETREDEKVGQTAQ